MKEMIKITMSLTVVCVAAALILGAVFAKTEHARKAIEEKERAETIEGLLGFGHGKVPSDLKIYPVYRYVVRDDKGTLLLGYLLPLKDKGQALLEINLEGKPVKVIPVQGEPVQLAERSARDKAIEAALPKGSQATYAETLNVAMLGDKRLGYVIPGITQGFKTFIKLMVSLNPELTVTGVAITESEEDPGLGAEINQDYFRNQFIGKTQVMLSELKVVKEPLPTGYLPALEPDRGKKMGLSAEQIKEIREKHLKDDIYALTGATISSRAVTRGVKDTVRKFAYRLGILNDAIKQEKVQVAFQRRFAVNRNVQLVWNGLIPENPIFRLALSLCPAVAVTTSVKNGVLLGVAVLFVQVMSSCTVAIFKSWIHPRIRIPAYVIIIALWVSCIDMILPVVSPAAYKEVALFVKLIVVFAIIISRLELFASKEPLVPSFWDGVGMGVGFLFGLALTSAIREFFGAGQLWGHDILGFKPLLIMILPAGGFFVIGFIMATFNWLEYKITGKIPASGGGH